MTKAADYIARLPMQTARAADMARLYTNPRAAVRILSDDGPLHRLAHGYYCLVPLGADRSDWKPAVEAAAGGIATAIYGERVPVLTGMSAARMHQAIPRAISKGEVAVPRQHRPIELVDGHGRIVFVKRDVDRLDALLMPTELGHLLVTTVEQTALDLARGKIGDGEQVEAIRALMVTAKHDKLEEIAATQPLMSALKRIERIRRRSPSKPECIA